jgi:two-component system sensor histidine kinase VicK
VEQFVAETKSDSKSRLRLRCITEIIEENISHCKELLNIVSELRHIDGIKGTFYHIDGIKGTFYVSDEGYLAPALVHDKDKPTSQVIRSNVREIIEQQRYLFETLWDKAISEEQKIQEIEKGILPETTNIIRDPTELQKLVHKLIRTSEKEILVVFSTPNAFVRQLKAGTFEIILEAASRNVAITILTPMNDTIKIIAKQLENQNKNRVQNLEPSSRITITAMIVDRRYSLAIELKDDSKFVTAEAIGTTTYSTSNSTVMSYVSMFESLMRLTELYEESQVKLQESIDDLALQNGI